MRAIALLLLLPACAVARAPDGAWVAAVGAAKATHCTDDQQVRTCTAADSLGVSSNFVELFRQLVQLPGRVAGAVLP